jgi:regulator of sirC expression with transglutaminase-like and TPR domain
MPRAIHCHPQAYQLFAEQIPGLGSSNPCLVKAAVAIAMHELEHADADQVLASLDALASRARGRLRSTHVEAVLAHLHEVLFEEEGFSGNTDDCFHPNNSYLPVVLETHRGIPITLTLIYKVVAEQLGLQVDGINAPGHFLARVRLETGSLLIDPFYGGRILTAEEAVGRVQEVTGWVVPAGGQYLPKATHRQWLARMLTNLQNIFVTRGRTEAAAAMGELKALLEMGSD